MKLRQAVPAMSYACPMIFDRSSLYDVDIDLDSLRLADVDSCPAPYTDNDNHFIYFNVPTATPVWCSDSVDGKAVLPGQLAEIVGLGNSSLLSTLPIFSTFLQTSNL
jgi:hypothetical protein